MGKVVKIAGIVAAVALAIPSGGTSLLAAGLGVSSLAASGIVLGLNVLSYALAKKPKVPDSQRERLFATIDPGAARKIVLGRTAMATDIRYEEWSGANQEYLDRIVAVASHKVEAITAIWIEDKLAWTVDGGPQGEYAGYLTVNIRHEGHAGNTIAINGGAKWGASRRLTGCAYVHLRFKTTGNSKKQESPFASSIPQRLTIVGAGAPMYDPRRDSTVPGGLGSHRADDQSTWEWVSDDVGNNTALQILWYLLGWRIEGKLAVGRGIPPARIDMASFIAAANLCDEAVALAAGGSEKRYRSAGVVSEADAATAVLEALAAACAGSVRDAGGRLSLSVLHNDLAAPVADFTDDDIIDDFDWQATADIAFNEVRGRYTDPSDNSLYQMVDYPAQRIASPDAIERPHPFDLAFVQSPGQAQRLAKQELQRARYPGVFRADFKNTAWRCQVGDVVRLTFSPVAFANKLFRVAEQVIRMDGTCGMVLIEENAAIYAWTAEDSPAVQAAAPTVYNPLNAPLIQAISGHDLTIEATTVVADAAAAQADATADLVDLALYPDGTLRPDTVGQDAILPGAINLATFETQGGTIAMGANDLFGSFFLAVDCTGGTLTVRLLLDYQVQVSDPDEGDEYYFLADLAVRQQSDATVYYSGGSAPQGAGQKFTIGEVWNAADASGTQKFSRKTVLLEHVFRDLPDDVYDIGYRIQTPALPATGAIFRPYRFLHADNPRAAQ
jgi:hypothetical protein